MIIQIIVGAVIVFSVFMIFVLLRDYYNKKWKSNEMIQEKKIQEEN